MNVVKKTATLLLAICIMICGVGCGSAGDAYDNFEPAGVNIVDYISDEIYEYTINDPVFAAKIWEKYQSLEIVEDPAAEISNAYLLLEMYNRDKSVMAVFTIYDNGCCCLGYDYDTLYKVEKGRTVYIELCEMYETYDPDAAAVQQ